MAKKKSKLKKILGGIAAAGTAALAAKALQKRKRNAAIDMGINAANADKGSDMLSPRQVNSFLPDDGFITTDNPYGEGEAKKGGSAGRKKRSTITGVAVRGFGRALNRK